MTLCLRSVPDASETFAIVMKIEQRFFVFFFSAISELQKGKCGKSLNAKCCAQHEPSLIHLRTELLVWPMTNGMTNLGNPEWFYWSLQSPLKLQYRLETSGILQRNEYKQSFANHSVGEGEEGTLLEAKFVISVDQNFRSTLQGLYHAIFY